MLRLGEKNKRGYAQFFLFLSGLRSLTGNEQEKDVRDVINCSDKSVFLGLK